MLYEFSIKLTYYWNFQGLFQKMWDIFKLFELCRFFSNGPCFCNTDYYHLQNFLKMLSFICRPLIKCLKYQTNIFVPGYYITVRWWKSGSRNMGSFGSNDGWSEVNFQQVWFWEEKKNYGLKLKFLYFFRLKKAWVKILYI